MCSDFTKFYGSVHYLFSYLIQDSTLYLVAMSSFSCMQQILVNSLFIFILLQIFSNFPCYGFLDTPAILKESWKRCLITKHMGFLKYLQILISHFDINVSFKCFLLCNHSLCFFQSSNYWGFQWLNQRSVLVNVTLHLKICGLFSIIFWYWFLTQFHSDKRTNCVISIFLGHEILHFMSLNMFQGLPVYSLWKLE